MADRRSVIYQAGHLWAMRCAAFSVDVDCDVNLPMKGRKEAVSCGQEGPRFTSSKEGLTRIVDMLDGCGIKGTFFFEARAAVEMSNSIELSSLLKHHEIAFHGLAHEDFTGEGTGKAMTKKEIENSFEDGIRLLKNSIECELVGFRAPYLHVNDDVLEVIKHHGFLYDSSIIQDMSGGRIAPYRAKNGVIEAPIACGKDSSGKRIVSYLWPLHEGRRTLEDYERLIEGFGDGLLILATHSWHPVETYKGRMSDERIESGLSSIWRLLRGAKDAGVRFTTIADHIKRME